MSVKKELSSGETGVSLAWDNDSAPLGECKGDGRLVLDSKADSVKS